MIYLISVLIPIGNPPNINSTILDSGIPGAGFEQSMIVWDPLRGMRLKFLNIFRISIALCGFDAI